jgi:hypothetical protein
MQYIKPYYENLNVQRFYGDYKKNSPKNNLSAKNLDYTTTTRNFPVMFKGYNYISQNQNLNEFWTRQVDDVFKNKDASAFLDHINTASNLKPLFRNVMDKKTIEKSTENNDCGGIFAVDALNLTTGQNGIKVKASKSSHLQVINEQTGKLFVEKSDLDGTKLDSTGKSIIAGGVRWLDPFDQADWQTVLGRQWPPADETRAKDGVANLSFDKSGKGILLETPDSVGQSYKTHPRALTILDSGNNSVIFAFQQENNNSEIDFGAWSIFPFKIKEGKETRVVFPVEKGTADKYLSKHNDFSEINESGQWHLDESKRFFTVNTSKPSPKSEHIGSDTNWCLFATEGDSHISLVRSVYKENTGEKQFKIYSGDESGGGTKYAELEFIAPKVKAKNKSTLVCRLDFIPLEKLGITELTKENIDEAVKQTAEFLNKDIR